MNRRNFLRSTALLSAATVLPRAALAEPAPFDPRPGNWRAFEIVTRVELASPAAASRVWLPLPSVEDPAWVKPMGNLWSGNADTMQVRQDPKYGAQMLFAQWSDGTPSPWIELVSRTATRDRAIDWSAPDPALRLDRTTARLYTEPTSLLPTDGIVRKTARQACKNARTDEERARAIYDWIVDNAFRDPKVRGCGLGDIRTMLETGNLGGKCADLNALFVGMCRSMDIAARDVYGIRVADSRFGYRSLGKSGDVTKAQHCRAEVWLPRFGWIAADPADVRKVVLEEQPGLTLRDPIVQAVREKLFGAWETNWLPYNFAHDVSLPGASVPKVPFLMYPQGENSEGKLDSLDPEHFRYRILAREIAL